MTADFTYGLQPFLAMEILARAKVLEAKGQDICHLEVGEPAMPPAPAVIAAAKIALPEPQRYTNSKGLIELRHALAAHYTERHGVTVDPEHILVTTGSSAGFLLAFLGAFGTGKKIAVTRPGYPAYLNILDGLGMGAVEIPVHAQTGWRLSASDIEAAHAEQPFDGLLFASPANPTGAAVDAEGLQAIIDACERLGVTLISDEIYHGLDFGGISPTALEFTDQSIVINSFSKYHCMTGWRIGWMVVPEKLVRRTEMLAQNFFISAPTLSQTAAVAALGATDYAEEQVARYRANRDILCDGLERLGLPVHRADGAFYAYADVSSVTGDSMQFCLGLLERAGIAATPGLDFDRVDGNRFVRFSYAGAEETMVEALSRLERFLSE